MLVRDRKEGEAADCPVVVETTAQEFLALRRLMESKGAEGVARFSKWLVGKSIYIEGGFKEWRDLGAAKLEEQNNRGIHQNTRN